MARFLPSGNAWSWIKRIVWLLVLAVAASYLWFPLPFLPQLPPLPTPPQDEVEIEIHLQQKYENDLAEVYIDDGLIFRTQIITDPYLNMPIAAHIPWRVKRGHHVLRVTLNNEVQGTFEFDTANARYISVNYDRATKDLVFAIEPTEPVYITPLITRIPTATATPTRAP